VKNIISGLNKLFDSRIRLGIMSILTVNDWVDFNTMKDLIETTDGNLASHITALEKNELIEIRKQFIGRKPNTRYRITHKGRELFKQHIDYLSQLIDGQNK
jgi:DNA-binding MarR family transcriptional regulator